MPSEPPSPRLPDLPRDADGRPMSRWQRRLSQSEVDRWNSIGGTGEWMPTARRSGLCFFD
ncbi:MAG TPA: hypothetical protein VN668_07980 [Stellaceae bacterium]|nr:hypothetical protein [Stellaceae bacterium]